MGDGFRPMRHVLKARELCWSRESIVVGAPAPASDGVSVGIVKRGERAALVEVRCRCGETILLECEYDADPGPKGQEVRV
jgi:hypothetical protein